MNQYTVYTGTFTNLKGQTRTMSFIKHSDLPSSVVGSGKSPRLAEGMETVWDINAGGFRTFNYKTAVGPITSKNTNFSFDKHR